MNISFFPLVTISPEHAYYTAGCRDIDFLPTTATSNLLRAGRMLARMREGALHLLYEAESPHVPVSSLVGETLYFGLHLSNPYFVNFTTPVLGDPKLTPLYTNATTPTALDTPIGVHLIAGLYAHAPTETNRPLTLTLRQHGGASVEIREMSSADNLASFDLRHLPPGRYRLDEEYNGSLVHQHQLLVDEDLRNSGEWGVIAITIDASFYSAAASFNLTFAPRQEKLRYYVVADNKFLPDDFDLLNVDDQGAALDDRLPITFKKILPPFPEDQGYIKDSLLRSSGELIAIFQSNEDVPRRDRGFKKLHLNRSSTVLIEHLPLPGPEKAQADLIVRLSKP
jgi:hypothetical protein